MSRNAAKIAASDALWESKKSAILHLYLSEDKPLKEVIDVMTNSYQFPARKSEYERYFKKWVIRKYLKSHEWKAVHHHVSKRKRDGKESDLYVDGTLISKKKVQKETSRHSFVPTWEQQIQAPSPEIPSRLLVCTPGALEMDWLQTTNLPWFRFESFLEYQANRPLGSATPDAVWPGFSGPGTITAASGQVSSPFSGDFLSTFNITEELRMGALKSVSNARGDGCVGNYQVVSSKLLSFMPEMRVGEHVSSAQTMLGPINQGARLQLAKFIIYLLSNNLSTALSKGSDMISRWLLLENNLNLLRFLLSTKEPTTEALAEALFRSAIIAQDPKVVEILLNSGLNPNEQIIDDFCNLYTPLKYVSKKGNLDLARILIKAGVGVNDTTGDCDGQTALQLAASSGTPELLTILISAGAMVNTTDDYGRSALQEAACISDIESVHILLSAGADVDHADDDGTTALHDSASSNVIYSDRIETVRLILSKDANINIADESGRTALHCAIERISLEYDFVDDVEGHVTLVRTLLGAGANINATNDDDETALDIALSYDGSMELMQSLLDARPQELGAALCYFARKREVEMVQTLLNAGANLDSCLYSGRTALTEAALINDITLVRLLLNAGADVNGLSPEWTRNKACTPLQAASCHDESLLAQVILNAGANVNDTAPEDIDDYGVMPFAGDALQLAAYNMNMGLIKILLDAGANVNAVATKSGYTALRAAVSSRNETLVSMLLNEGAYVNAKAGKHGGRTALQTAVELGNEDYTILECLLDAGADVDGLAAEFHGTTALTAAIKGGDIKVVHLLLNEGADVNNPSARLWGVTALDMATATGNMSLVRLLLRIGADANDPIALWTAVEVGDIELVRILLTARANVNGLPWRKYGPTALQAAVMSSQIEIVQILLHAGVDANSPASECPENCLSFDHPRYLSGRRRKTDISYGANALKIAVDEDNIPVAQMLLDAKADPDIVTGASGHKTVLTTATSKGNVPLVKILLEAGADVNKAATGKFERTALQKAAEKGNIDLVKLFLKSGADVNAAPCKKGGVTALQAAAIGGYFGIARILLNAKADVNAAPAEEDGRTALEGAVEHGRIDMLQLLLDAGAEIEGSGRAQYDRALALGAKHGHHAACRLLRSYHASRYGDPLPGKCDFLQWCTLDHEEDLQQNDSVYLPDFGN